MLAITSGRMIRGMAGRPPGTGHHCGGHRRAAARRPCEPVAGGRAASAQGAVRGLRSGRAAHRGPARDPPAGDPLPAGLAGARDRCEGNQQLVVAFDEWITGVAGPGPRGRHRRAAAAVPAQPRARHGARLRLVVRHSADRGAGGPGLRSAASWWNSSSTGPATGCRRRPRLCSTTACPGSARFSRFRGSMSSCSATRTAARAAAGARAERSSPAATGCSRRPSWPAAR